ncbi:MAG: hypothetical protein ACPG5B_06730 [Chitinophagales bacterium]
MKKKIYISNAGIDDEFAKTIIKHLRLADVEILHPSQTLAHELLLSPFEYIAQADISIVLLSSDFIHEYDITKFLQHPCKLLFVQLRPLDIEMVHEKHEPKHEFYFTQIALSMQNELAYVKLANKICEILKLKKPPNNLLIELKLLLVLLKLEI